MRDVRVALLPNRIDWPHRGAAVVIDVLRATTVITQAIASGADQVVVCAEIQDALRWREAAPQPLLCGERGCRLIPGFDLANSPSEYNPAAVAGRHLVITTTNGTRAAVAAADFHTLYAASFNNLSSLVAALEDEAKITLICAGTDGAVSDDDALLAGALLQRLKVDPDSVAAEQALQSWRDFQSSGLSLSQRLAASLGGKGLLEAGFVSDIDACAQVDTVTAIAMAVKRDPITFVARPQA